MRGRINMERNTGGPSGQPSRPVPTEWEQHVAFLLGATELSLLGGRIPENQSVKEYLSECGRVVLLAKAHSGEPAMMGLALGFWN